MCHSSLRLLCKCRRSVFQLFSICPYIRIVWKLFATDHFVAAVVVVVVAASVAAVVVVVVAASVAAVVVVVVAASVAAVVVVVVAASVAAVVVVGTCFLCLFLN